MGKGGRLFSQWPQIVRNLSLKSSVHAGDVNFFTFGVEEIVVERYSCAVEAEETEMGKEEFSYETSCSLIAR